MMEALKQVGILYGQKTASPITEENIKTAFFDQMTWEEVEEFCQPLEILLVTGVKQEASRLIEECPCALLWFGETAPEILPEKYDAGFVKTNVDNQENVVRAFAMLAQETLQEGFDVFGEVEDIISRFTNFTNDEVNESHRLLLWLGCGIGIDSSEQEEFLKRAEYFSNTANENGQEFFCSYSLSKGNQQPSMLLFAAEEKTEE